MLVQATGQKGLVNVVNAVQGGVRGEACPFVGDYVPLALPAFYFKIFFLIKLFLSAPAVFLSFLWVYFSLRSEDS